MPRAWRAEGEGDFSDASGAEKKRCESAKEPVAQRQVRRPPAIPTENDELLLEHEILCGHRSYTTGTTQLRRHDSKAEPGDQQFLHRESA